MVNAFYQGIPWNPSPFFSKRKEGVFLDNILKCDNIERHIYISPLNLGVFYFKSFKNSCSFKIGIFSFLAFSSLLPGESPTTKYERSLTRLFLIVPPLSLTKS